ncbi:hypothetical protein SAMN05444008_12511 [Cnuella takakiae]|uniref:Uncharacterized protein n=1 Tax=Cnuella takakiae TaxID=1302690 RepID=A0A1M5IQ04_9BACT|nr:hypothetical protein [Cnuella takakiae]OLY93949.1 hypothetical protein BUE76_20240 [Cnuella takakiae]SHG30408.1 hypothetical protein SAMN05444008_12511 [Cnuella takakiae]
MSFETNDTNPIINLSNYEEYFLLYVDDELNGQEKAAVDAFLTFHPELRSELDLLMGTRLEPEFLSFGAKEELLAASMGQQVVDENLLLHVDGELDEAARKATEQKLQADEAYRNQFQLLLRTKSDPAEIIPYPNKEELYRRNVYRMRTGFVMRVAAAVLLIASLGVLYYNQQGTETGNQNTGMAKAGDAKPAITQPSGTISAPDRVTIVPNDQLAKKGGVDDKENATSVASAAIKQGAELAYDKPVKAARNTSPQTAQITMAAQPREEDQAVAYQPITREATGDMPLVRAGKKELHTDVTSADIDTYNLTNADAEVSFAANTEEKGRGNLKSLLRKATRMVERRTGINATNEDEELLIGVVAVKLK